MVYIFKLEPTLSLQSWMYLVILYLLGLLYFCIHKRVLFVYAPHVALIILVKTNNKNIFTSKCGLPLYTTWTHNFIIGVVRDNFFLFSVHFCIRYPFLIPAMIAQISYNSTNQPQNPLHLLHEKKCGIPLAYFAYNRAAVRGGGPLHHHGAKVLHNLCQSIVSILSTKQFSVAVSPNHQQSNNNLLISNYFLYLYRIDS